ncbi:DUF5615 family PIN-like protein [Runella sp.]|jgi:predicted nuclease of predicted toxin-antitoxin system|uniref:DUF5615 family PIN-like protein n=1 Tax=Runella sp. TaxID=1960881 RepID=UPI00262D6990|nr:DUF5615 family PIN-like protein [Runella sp.]
MIVCDENLSQRWINLLTGNGYEFFSIREHLAGISDTEVTQIAIDKNALILTEDKDFGDIVFAQNIKKVSVVLLRYNQPDYETVSQFLLATLQEHFKSEEHCFYTIIENDRTSWNQN